ncbi:hypothetical protein EDF71_121109 [Comamonas sp. JUb58]|nr:hypothetical protein EDF71_121109 [Comamonas sp. JUb58]
MFKFSAYPPASFWDRSKFMLGISSVPAPQEQEKKPPTEPDKAGQDQQIAGTYPFKFL